MFFSGRSGRSSVYTYIMNDVAVNVNYFTKILQFFFTDPVRRRRAANLILLGLGILVVVLAILSFLVGRFPISPDKVVAMLADRVIPIDPFWTDQ